MGYKAGYEQEIKPDPTHFRPIGPEALRCAYTTSHPSRHNPNTVRGAVQNLDCIMSKNLFGVLQNFCNSTAWIRAYSLVKNLRWFKANLSENFCSWFFQHFVRYFWIKLEVIFDNANTYIKYFLLLLRSCQKGHNMVYVIYFENLEILHFQIGSKE
jgi:hypothetical protein